jgi:hypothetical protein
MKHSIITALLCMSCGLSAQVTEIQRVTAFAGGTASSATHILTDVVGQTSPVGYSHNSSYLCSAGFFHTATNQPAIGVDGDNDTLTDWQELSGSRFSPLTPTDTSRADSDADGASDEDEILTGTNPMDADSNLRFLAIERVGTGATVRVVWTARQDLNYLLYEGVNLRDSITNFVAVTNVTGGSGVGEWLTTQSEVTYRSQWTNAFYKVGMSE